MGAITPLTWWLLRPCSSNIQLYFKLFSISNCYRIIAYFSNAYLKSVYYVSIWAHILVYYLHSRTCLLKLYLKTGHFYILCLTVHSLQIHRILQPKIYPRINPLLKFYIARRVSAAAPLPCSYLVSASFLT